MIARQEAEKVRDKLVAMLRERRDVTGIGIVRHGDGYGVRVNLSSSGICLPPEIDGVPIVTRTIGPVAAYRPPSVVGMHRQLGD
ncbi:hypothetical protein E9549_05560 [Blastococcus sp. MG754426]|uniref:hypothetical protein n=1 Tax=unclassified Blastococcus TaxID=2619396 RepID=UPI001EF0D230|nr:MULTISPECIES: hypothetical protein [unclassified Blastococcus]MCF6506873.1 hypothetical protein [Blastococcus sp. MG754426]MCF6511673.1 hypothetical protein [Blastococcus sp. MG754427]